MKRFYFASLLALFTIASRAQEDAGLELLRYPSLNPDGTQITFSYQGDIWSVAATGGVARRLTIHESYASHPQYSPDGRYILFQSNRYGNDDLFAMEAGGDAPRRLTYFSGSDESARWGPNNVVYFTSRRAFAAVEREDEIHQVSVDGGTPFRAMDALGLMPAPSPDGRYIAFIRGSCRTVREAYQGPANRDIWLFDTENNTYQQITTFEGQDIYPDWGPDNQLYFLSARNGRYNLQRVPIKNGEAAGEIESLTNFESEGIRYFDLSANGERLVYERGVGIYLINPNDTIAPEEIPIQVTNDYRFDPVVDKSYSSELSEYALSPKGEYISLGIRGELFVFPEDEDKKRSTQVTDHPFRDQEAAWLNDSTLIFISDRGGKRDIHLLRSNSDQESNLHKSLRHETLTLTDTEAHEYDLHLSPDRQKIAFRRGRGQLIVAEISPEGRIFNEQVLLDGWATPSGISWSPDNQWLAYSLTNLDFNREIYIHPADDSQEPVNVSLHPRGDYSPVWSADGSKLGFLSNRNDGNNDVWFVWLRKEDWEKTKRDWEEEDDEDMENAENDSTGVTPIEIDFDDIHKRLAQVTRLPGNEGNLMISKDGETFYFSVNQGDNSFMSVKWDGSDMTTILEDQFIYRLQWDSEYKNIYMLTRGGGLAKLDPTKKKVTRLPFQAEMELDIKAQRRQIFDEAWRELQAGFYDPDFHGRDWRALREKYEDRALMASTAQDFRDMFNEMLGQLDASHMGLYMSTPEETQNQQTGRLGIEVTPVDGGVKITRVVPGSPADRTDSRLAIGEVITAVNDLPLERETNFYRTLKGAATERTLLSVRGADGAERELVIRPASSIRTELYEAWVEARKDLTDEYSNGRLGYIHIRGMNWPSFERFERELTASGQGKEGIVIDVRYNGGGWTTDMLMTVLNVRQHAYTVPRGAADSLAAEHEKFRDHYPFGERLPLSAWTKPSIALCNRNSYSNAEIFSHAYKTLGIGTLVGEPTFGAVISTGGHRLMDGSFVRMPFRAWYVKATDENMEHGPAVPDIAVEEPPASRARGEDPQLKIAVETLLNQIGGQ